MTASPALLVVGVSDCRVSSQEESSLITYALGSCIALAIHDPVARVGGMLHLMLPDSSLDPVKAAERPYMFADTGIPLLFLRAYAAGAEKRRLAVHIAGGAQVIDDKGLFNIGKRNHLAVRKVLWRAGVLVASEAVGGNESRTVRLEVGSGRFCLRSAGAGEIELGGKG